LHHIGGCLWPIAHPGTRRRKLHRRMVHGIGAHALTMRSVTFVLG